MSWTILKNQLIKSHKDNSLEWLVFWYKLIPKATINFLSRTNLIIKGPNAKSL